MSDDVEADLQRTYGGFTKPGRRGLFGFSLWAFFGLLLSLVPVIVLWVAVSVKVGIAAMVLLILIAVPMLWPRKDGRGVYERWLGLLADRVGEALGNHDLANGPAGNAPDGSFRVPGLAADSTLSTQRDVHGSPYALISYPRVNHHVVVFECYPPGNSLAGQGAINRFVDYWAAFQAYLGTERRVVAATVTVETATDSGLRLRRAVLSRMSDIAPQFTRAVVGRILERFNVAAPAISTKVAVTVSGRARSADDDAADEDEVVAELAQMVPTLREGLTQTGAGAAVRTCTEADLVDFVRTAYDPLCSDEIEELRNMGQGTGLRWDEAGPVAARAHRDYYEHDGVVSMSWTMASGPREVIYDTALSSLLAPDARLLRKRVTLVYRPELAERTGAIVDQTESNSIFAGSMRQGRARTSMAQAQAKQMAREEARGAGLVRLGLVVTCTVASPDQVRLAQRIVKSSASPSKMKIRAARGSQDVAFQAGLPIGVSLPHHSTVSVDVKDAL